ncbi:MAG TPA: hypothetical protein VGP85_10105 [Pyrinomonadaceae bacterium]|jgi:uncharacterized membrane protein YeaQ/YmgE (transglycosylase-associated protein family)|nr:hypothetical protein [Pyrinomonadaceae bacterium]
MVSLRVWVIAIFTGLLMVAAAFVLLSGNAKLGLIIPLPIIGLVVGGLIMPLTETAGGMLRAWTLLAGVIGSVVAGMLAARMGLTLFGAGSQLISSYVAAALGALIFVLVSRLVTKALT